MFMNWFSKFFGNKTEEKDNNEEKGKASFFDIPFQGQGLTPEREEELINGVVEKVKDYGMEGVALMLLYPLKAVNVLVAQIGVLPFAPFLELFGLRGYDYATFINKRENIESLIKKIEENYV